MAVLLDEHPHLGVEPVLRELHIASSTYYRWRRAEKEPCERRRQDAELTEKIQRIHADSGGTYGSPRVHAVLKREGVHVGRKRVERLMREDGLAGISPRRIGFTRRDSKATLAPDLVQRDFTAFAPNRLWVTDLTMISTGEGPLWLSAIRDAFSRRVVAWETSARADADLVCPRWSTPWPAGRSSPDSSFTTRTTAANTHPSSSQHACCERELRHPWGPSGTPTRQRSGREPVDTDQDRVRPRPRLRHSRRGEPCTLRVHRRLL
ncbi:IS3 family transposase [Streptomyces dengpaensis]|uniref:IS3 family transposase n=1 Tax=Streptomyces dengpaensis TaxID=2049881 RepID=A0ABN5ICA2_9ACTN|nr:IS3 family transposase [Streptomyces dengpaensis]